MAWARANVDLPGKGGFTPLMYAASEGQCEVAR